MGEVILDKQSSSLLGSSDQGSSSQGSSSQGSSEVGTLKNSTQKTVKRYRKKGALSRKPKVQAVQTSDNAGDNAGIKAVDQKRKAPRAKARDARGQKKRATGRYLMCIHVEPDSTQIAVLEGRMLLEHYVSRDQNDDTQINGNIYLGVVKNVLPGMEAAFVDIGTQKNAVLYWRDIRYDPEDLIGNPQERPRIEQVLKPEQTLICQVIKNPIATKGARLTQQVSLPGRVLVLVPNTTAYGISQLLPDRERKRLRALADKIKPEAHGLIIRTAAKGAGFPDLEEDLSSLLKCWEEIESMSHKLDAPALLYTEPKIGLRVLREEFNADYRGVLVDDRGTFEQIKSYVESITPELSERVEFYDEEEARLSLFDRYHVTEQLNKALERKVWLPSGGSLIIEGTEALTVIDVNTSKNVGTSNLEETVYQNNLEAAQEIARQLRLRDIGGIIVIDFIDMEIEANRINVVRALKEALGRDKTRTQVLDVSKLGIVEMTRKRVSEGLLETLSGICPTCQGRGIILS